MRKIVYSMFTIMSLFISSISLVSCEAITAQNININSGGGMNGGPRGNGNQGNNGNFIGTIMNTNIMGKIISIEGNSIMIELVEQTQNSKTLNSNRNQNNKNKKSSKEVQETTHEFNGTGIEKTVIINDNVDISQASIMKNQNDNAKSSMKISDLEKDQIIMIWYKEDTETVERISVIKS
ncbi:hypothetical protein [Clostridium chromiireducens]|uniref:Lipoprotein n=1 Tax=Clostridium chromiireducens TaxID=225345 RepID=A0A1V4IBF0_9CLOT|nr:hypothetical protein [Clostridium chromiireducens]OPJ57328.1 hypothetical protein CLCHR_44660 [Clostridium chromiireducens]